MKKKLLKIFALVFCVGLIMTGCATVSKVKINGKNANFSELQYNQGQVLVIGDYLYYGNGYTASSDSGFNYKSATSTGYLSRIDLSKSFTFGNVKEEEKAYSSPQQIEKVNDKKLFGYQYQDMYALGEYIYFTSANTHKTTDMKNDYSQVSLFRIKFNGDGLKELVKNSAFKQGEGSTITVQKGSDNNYYYIIVEPTENSTFSIKSLKIGKKIGKLKTLAENVTSYAIADKNSNSKNIIYTVNSEQTQTTTAVKSVDFATGNKTDLDNGVTGTTIKFVGRAGDIVFYNYTQSTTKPTIYYKDISNGDGYYNPSVSKRFYNAEKISNIYMVGDGYVFTSNGALIYKELDSNSVPLMTKEEFTDILFVENDYVYASNKNSIKRISTIDKQAESILDLGENELVSGQCGYDGEYIYYYSKIVIPSEDENNTNNNTDGRYYMFRTDKHGRNQLIGKKA